MVICARRADVLEATATTIATDTGGSVLPVVADVSRADEVERLIATTVERFGRIDALVNNAGTSRAGPFDGVSDDEWQADLDLKLFAAIRTIRLAVPHMRAAGAGSIVNVLSTSAKSPSAASLPTSVSRAAGMALTKALSKELGPAGIRVNAVLIGLVEAAQHEQRWQRSGAPGTLDEYYAAAVRDRGVPLGRAGTAAEVADLITFLCSPRGAYVSGAAINVDGGSSPAV